MIDSDKYKIMSQDELNSSFLNACDDNNLELVSFLLTSSELKLHANIHYRDEMGLFCAINQENLQIIKYLLSSPDLKEHSDIHYKNDFSLQNSCYFGNLEIIKFLLSAPELKEHANFFANEGHFFKLCCEAQDLRILHYLIFDYNLEKTTSIEKYLNAYPSANFFNEVRNMFKTRDLKCDLEDKLDTQNNPEKKKIKI